MLNLAAVLDAWLWQERLSKEEAARRIGISPSSFTRITMGASVKGDVMARVAAFLFTDDGRKPIPSTVEPPREEPEQKELL